MRPNKLESIRQDRGMSRRALAEASETTARAIRAWEEGTRDLEKAAYISIIKISKALGCLPADLFKTEDTEKKEARNGR